VPIVFAYQLFEPIWESATICLDQQEVLQHLGEPETLSLGQVGFEILEDVAELEVGVPLDQLNGVPSEFVHFTGGLFFSCGI